MKHKRRISLNTKLLLWQMASLGVALIVFFGGLFAGSAWINTCYLSDAAVQTRESDYISDFSAYVTDNGIASTDSKALSQWAKQQKYVYLTISNGGNPIFETDGYDMTIPAREELQNAAKAEQEAGNVSLEKDENGYYHIRFQDGVFEVVIVDFSETPYYYLSITLSLLFAGLLLGILNARYNRSVTKAIIRLSKEVHEAEQGSVQLINADRRDELGELADSVNRMRVSIVERVKREQEALQANASLITAISHDIRTPLTALLGYLDLLEGKQYRTEEQMAQYLHAGREKAQQLKVLTDELFRYFLVFSKEDMKLNIEHYDAVILMEQLLGEAVIRLRDQGFTVQEVHLQTPCVVCVDVQYLQRVFDNLFSNIQKHGDRTKKVTLLVRLEDNWLKIDLANGIPSGPTGAESNKIGLQTCRKILQQMGGQFEETIEKDQFLVELALPVAAEEKE